MTKSMLPNADDLITPKEAARQLGVVTRSVYELIEKKELKAMSIKTGPKRHTHLVIASSIPLAKERLEKRRQAREQATKRQTVTVASRTAQSQADVATAIEAIKAQLADIRTALAAMPTLIQEVRDIAHNLLEAATKPDDNA